MTYSQAVEYLFSLQFFGIKLGLENIRRLCAQLGNPQEQFKSIHVAGTNGKGSTCALVESVLRRAGYATGLYTSPHLVDFCERIQAGGKLVDQDFVTRFTERIQPLATELKATFFEVTTALAFSWFAEKNVDIAVIETGMGGRLDATNILDPLLCVITPISVDHVQYLGNTVEQIAGEKAGIIKPGVPAVVSNMDSAALNVLLAAAKERRSPATVAGRTVIIDEVTQAGRGYRFTAITGCLKLRLEIPLAGKHQLKNAVTALAVVNELRKLRINISNEAICAGFGAVRWPARFEISGTLPGMVLDVSHNLAGAQTLVETFGSFFPGKKPLLVLGLMHDKDIGGFMETVKKLNGRIIATRPNIERAAPVSEIAEQAGEQCFAQEPTVAQAVERAKKSVGKDEVLVITGSFYTTGEAMVHLGIQPF